MKKYFIFLFLFFLIGMSSCSTLAVESGREIIVTDTLQREVKFNRPPSRIVISGRQTPMITHFFYLFESAGEKIYAIENRSQTTEAFIKLIDAGIQDKYKIEMGASAEQIIPLKPDVVVMKTIMRDSVGLQLEDLDVPVIYVDFESIDDIYRDIENIALLLDEETRGEEIIENYKKMKADIDKRIKVKTEKYTPSVLILQSDQEDQIITFSVPSINWLQTAMVKDLGAKPVWEGTVLGSGWSDVNLEQIAAWDADIIFLINYKGNAPLIMEEIMENDIWQQLNAVKNRKIYPFIFDFLSWDQPDPRWILAYSWMANRIYPDLVPSDYVQQNINDFFTQFFMIDDNQFFIEMNKRLASYF